jgi:restriction system protein
MNINGFEDELYKKKSQEYIDIEEMSSSEFENFIKDLFVLMEYDVDNTKSYEIEGADLIIEKSGEKTAVQAKSFLDFVKDSDVKDVIKAKEYYSCDKAMIVASSFFTKNLKMMLKHGMEKS